VSNQKYIIEQIETYVRRGGSGYENWFIGLADNPITPIKEVSRLRKAQNRTFAYVETMSSETAKTVADYFINVRGMNGNISETKKDDACRALYLYKKAEHLVARENSTSSRLIYRVHNKVIPGLHA